MFDDSLEYENISVNYPVNEVAWLKSNDINYDVISWSNPFDDVYFTLNIMFGNDEQKAEYVITF